MKLLQLSDLHVNDTCKGSFTPSDNLDAVIEKTRLETYGAIIITGDLINDGKENEYNGLLDKLDHCYNGTPIVVTPGNHDDRENLQRAYANYLAQRRSRFSDADIIHDGSFEVPGQANTVLYIPDNKAVVMVLDSGHKQFPFEGLLRARFNINQRYKTSFKPFCVMFTHMPVFPVFHRFMNDPSRTMQLDRMTAQSIVETVPAVDLICCGHYHCHSSELWERGSQRPVQQIVAPAIQMQIDPFAKDFLAGGKYPGYMEIRCDGAVTVKESYCLD